MIKQQSQQFVPLRQPFYPTILLYLNYHLLYDLFVSSEISVNELLGIWPTVKFTSDTKPFFCNAPSLTLFSFSLTLTFSPLCFSHRIVCTCLFPYKKCEFVTKGIIELTDFAKPTFTSFWVSTQHYYKVVYLRCH